MRLHEPRCYGNQIVRCLKGRILLALTSSVVRLARAQKENLLAKFLSLCRQDAELRPDKKECTQVASRVRGFHCQRRSKNFLPLPDERRLFLISQCFLHRQGKRYHGAVRFAIHCRHQTRCLPRPVNVLFHQRSL